VPFEGDSSVAIAMQHVSDEPPSLRSLAPLVPETLGMVVAHAMLKDPSQRYASADEFAADLDRVRRGLVPAAATAMIAIPHEHTEQVPAAEATRIAPRGESTPLLSGEKLPPRPVPRKRSRWPWLLVLLLVLAVGALAAFALGVGSGKDKHNTTTTNQTTATTAQVTVRKLDDLEGKSFLEAQSTLNGYGLKLDVKRQRVRDASHEAEVVVASDPQPGTELHQGDRVVLKVSRGQKEIPNIVGATVADALDQLGSDFKPQQESEASGSTDKGKITRTDPAVGLTVPVGSTVKLWVSTGPAQIQVPNIKGKTEDEARSALRSAGLIVHEPPGARCSDDYEVGQVAKQLPEVGTLVKADSAVRFDLTNSPCTVDVPNVRTLPQEQAIQLLQAKSIAAGNIIIKNQTVTQADQAGIVLDQDIEGTNVKPFKVTLTVGVLDTTSTTPSTTP
jgi:serine/threonine-protein kinase